ncbi:TonB-dependent siderophore receptor [Methylocystis sp. MJC1]|jgi:catecholate siderophore receptor|uniref:TonB-dependent receptor n=1 Tax=Methylocystis sp. MJC1 TaxID=2654282 RepID=UPI0013EBDCF5|nr:TonB-dependent siderophore receptor [Methylocystis sp. MJC1]KAF2992102.1 putative TonB-dependent receptor BfrD [Methylocystis sp. MJC1]MBU6527244.1 TonB-dependent siderophore receptor [Methylocystis sp. MJC1]UZX10202.1 TonB-dependent siderophore receptor [Methylocystis sp. MJC1]
MKQATHTRDAHRLAGLCALSAALTLSHSASAQQSLPTIDVGGARRATAHAPAPRTQRPVTAAPIATAPARQPAPFVPQGEQIWRGPTNVVGYVAGGTSTATKTDTPIRDIPQAITILTKQQLEDRNSLTLGQALSYVPGVTVAQGEGQRDQLTIRGQPTTADFYTDGVRDDAEYYRDLYNIQAVEVLKGPSALIFGRGGGGGVVNRVTKKADGETLRALQVSTGSFGRKRVTFDVGQAINDQLAARVNGLFEQSYSYRDYFNMKRWGINPTFTWKPFEKTFVTLSYEHYFDYRTMDRGVPSVNWNANPTIVAAQNLGAAYLFPGYPASTDRSTFFGNPTVNYAKTDVDRAVLMVDHTTDSGLNIKNQTVFAHYAKFYQNSFANNAVAFSGCAGALPPCVQLSGYNNETPRQNIFNQTDLTYTLQMTPQIKHTLLAGMEFGNQKSDTNRNNARWLNPFTGSANINTFFGYPTTFLPVVFNNPSFRRHTDLDLAAGYVQDQISVTKYVDILAGVRFDSYSLKFVNNLINPAPTSDNYWGQSLTNNVARWSPRFGLVFKPFEQLSLYGSYSRSFLPAAGDQFNTLTISQANMQPQGFENAEAGFKAEITPTLLFTGAIYNLNRTNQPVSINAFYNVLTDTRTVGGELGLVGQVTQEWQVSLGYGNQHAYVTSSDRVPLAGIGPLFTEKGKVVPSVPQNTFSFWNKYDVSSLLGLAPGVLGLGSGVIYNDKFYAALDNAVVIPGYARWDGAVYVKVSENVSAQVNVENILNASYYASAHNNNNIMPGAPRSAFVTVNAKF